MRARACKMFEKVDVPVLGIVENMSMHVCSQLRPRRAHLRRRRRRAHGARSTACRCSARCRSTSRIREQADAGTPTVVADPDAPRSPRLSRDRAPHGGRARAPRAQGSLQRQFPKIVDPEYRGPAMSIKSDRWIRRMAAAARHDRAVRARPGARRRRPARSSPTARRATATTCAARASSRSSPTSTRRSSTRRTFDPKQLRRLQRRRLHHPAELVRAGAHGRVLPHPAQRADDLPRQDRPTRAAASSST